MSPIFALRNQLRGLLNIRRDRELPRRGTKPRIGACVVRGEVRMTVQAGMSNELWGWLLDHGWRELTYRPDRRRYREIPASWVTRLVDCEPEVRARVLTTAVGRASLRPTLGNDPEALPVYVERD